MIKPLKITLGFFTLLLLLTSCTSQKPKADQNTIRVSCEDEPHTLDPRQARDLASSTAIHLLYEGLMRSQGGEKPELALAESYTISPDQKTYTFKIRPSSWNNGVPITAHDFEASWKSVLDPSYAAPNAYQLYIIKNAQLAKEGKTSIDNVGIHSLDSSTLVVELENPTPYFLELLSNYFYYPVFENLRLQDTASPLSKEQIVTNGAYQIDRWKQKEVVAIPNPHYWDRKAVHVDQIRFIILDNPTAYQLYEKDGLDWAGSPLATLPIDALQSLKKSGQLHVKPSAGVHLFRVNTEKSPFTDSKIRRAFAYALNRHDLAEHVLQGSQTPAMGFVPPSISNNPPFFKDHDLTAARLLFKQYLKENNETLSDIPTITILYPNGERSHKIAQVVQQQWKDAFGLEPQLQSVESKVFFSQLKSHDYQLAIGSWYADFLDPISYLEIFKSKDNGTNNTQWENKRYTDLLNASATADPLKRKEILLSAEKLLMDEMPIIPLFFNSYNYLQRPKVTGVYFSELGYLDFKNASVDQNR